MIEIRVYTSVASNKMKEKCISQYYLELGKKVELNFNFDKCAVDTVHSINGFNKKKKNQFGFLRLSIEYELKEYETISDGAIFSRSRYLNLLGIISFLLDEPFDVFGTPTNRNVFPKGIEGLNIRKEKKLIVENKDLTKFLIEITDTLEKSEEHEKSLIFSLLDRWRKGRFLEKDSDERLLYNDEATLSYFHVLELLGDVYSKSLKMKSKELIEGFAKTFNTEILSLNGHALESENSVKTKLFTNLLNKEISVGSKILFLFKKFGLYSNQTAFWIKNLIDARNGVAHGRRVHYDKAIFPVQPFFPLITDILYPLEFLRILTAKTISSHLKTTLFDKQWEEIEKSLILDNTSTKAFLKRGNFSSINELSEEERRIVFGGLNYYVLQSKIKPLSCTKFYDFYLNTEIENEEFLWENIDAIVLLYEVMNEPDIETKLETAIINIYNLDCNRHNEFRDMRYFLDFNNFDSPKLESLIIKGKIR